MWEGTFKWQKPGCCARPQGTQPGWLEMRLLVSACLLRWEWSGCGGGGVPVTRHLQVALATTMRGQPALVGLTSHPWVHPTPSVQAPPLTPPLPPTQPALPPLGRIPGRRYPVDILYTKAPEADYLHAGGGGFRVYGLGGLAVGCGATPAMAPGA